MLDCGAQWDPWQLPSNWRIHDDGGLVVVNKPAGISVMAGGPDAAGDLISRVRRLRESGDDYLAAHVHLDRDVSGVVVLAGRRDANAQLARQAQRREMRMTYLAVLTASEGLLVSDTIRVRLMRDRSGHFRPDPRGRQCFEVTYRVVKRVGSKVLVEVWSLGGARVIRAAFVSLGFPVDGEPLAGRSAPRLMLHANSVSLVHPISGEKVRFEAPLPWIFEPWLKGIHAADALEPERIAQGIQECACARQSLYRDPSIEAFRIVHGEGEGLGGLDVEWLGGYAVVWVKEDAGAGASVAIMDALAPFRPRGIYLKVRPKQASRLESEASLFSAHVHKGIDAPDPHWVREGDLYYGLRLGEGLGTGLFLDQRANRAWLSAHSRGKRVLNLFAYTCSFTVAAAAGGSSSTVSVDISKRGLEEGAHNLRRNGFSEKNNELICDDVQRWLNQACRKKIQFDIVVFDPPSFGTSPHGRFVATRDYIDLASQCMKLIAPRGWLLACTNRRVITKTKLRNWLEQGAKDAGRSIVSWRDVSAGQDFPHWVGGEPHMKAMLCGL